MVVRLYDLNPEAAAAFAYPLRFSDKIELVRRASRVKSNEDPELVEYFKHVAKHLSDFNQLRNQFLHGAWDFPVAEGTARVTSRGRAGERVADVSVVDLHQAASLGRLLKRGLEAIYFTLFREKSPWGRAPIDGWPLIEV